MRIGDILLSHGWVDDDSLARALAEQIDSGQRLCSLLLARGVIAFDHAAKALGEQLGVPAVLHRHLEHRDPALAALIPAQLGTSAVVLPIGRQGNGTLIVAARDPSPALEARLARTIQGPLLLAVAPARYIEKLVDQAYRPRPADFELEVDVEAPVVRPTPVPPALAGPPARPTPPPLPARAPTAPVVAAPPPLPARAPTAPAGVAPPPPAADLDFDIDVEAPPPPPPEPAPGAPPPRASTALPVAIPAPGASSGAPRASKAPKGSLEALIASFDDIDEPGWLWDVVLAYVATRWHAALLLAIDGAVARGERGAGAQLGEDAARAVTVPLGTPSIVHQAFAQRRLIDAPPPGAGAAQAELVAALGDARAPVAAALQRGGAVTHVLAVGDPRAEDPADAAIDLARLVEAIDEARARIEG